MAGTATLGLSNILSAGLKLALLNWERMSEFTADRAGFLCCQNIRAVMTVFMKLSGLPARYYRDCESRVDAFIAQAEAFDALDSSGMHKFVKYATILSDNHPWLIMRGRELLAWQQSGAYEGLLDACAPRPVRLPDGEAPAGEAPAAEAPAAGFCPHCGERLEEGDRFCAGCGARLGQA